MREHKCCFLHNNRPAVLLMQPCITIGCQLISPLSKYLKALVLTKKVSTLFERTRSLVTFLKNAQNSLSQPDISSPGTISSRGYLSKLDVSEGPCTCKYISFFLVFLFSLIKTFGVIGGSRVRLSKPSQSKPCNKILKNRAIIEIQLYFYNGEQWRCLFSRQKDF